MLNVVYKNKQTHCSVSTRRIRVVRSSRSEGEEENTNPCQPLQIHTIFKKLHIISYQDFKLKMRNGLLLYLRHTCKL